MTEASTSRSRGKRQRSGGEVPANSMGCDVLCSVLSFLDHFDLVRCSAVCKSWNKTIYTSSLIKDLYYKRNPLAIRYNSSIPIQLMKRHLEELAFDEHESAFLGSAQVFQWKAHPSRANLCRMKRGFILTGVGDKVLRLWSAQTCKFMDEYQVPEKSSLVDYDFDENKIVGLTNSKICIWRRNEQKGIFQSREGIFTHGLCMSYLDPEVVIGCEDGRARVFDMYSRNCSRIIKLQSGPLTCLTITDDQLLIGGSTFGSISISDLISGERLAFLKSAYSPTGMKCLSYNSQSRLVFAGSTSGYAHCWDLRTLKPLWEKRVSPNVIYSAHHMQNDNSTLAIGGLDGILRILDQNTGEIIRSFYLDPRNTGPSVKSQKQNIERKNVISVEEGFTVERVARHLRPPITCLRVGMKKIVTTHGDDIVRVWRFHK